MQARKLCEGLGLEEVLEAAEKILPPETINDYLEQYWLGPFSEQPKWAAMSSDANDVSNIGYQSYAETAQECLHMAIVELLFAFEDGVSRWRKLVGLALGLAPKFIWRWFTPYADHEARVDYAVWRVFGRPASAAMNLARIVEAQNGKD